MLLMKSGGSRRRVHVASRRRSFSVVALAGLIGASIFAGVSAQAESVLLAQASETKPKEVPLAPDSQSGTTLSEKLDRSKGVLRPPADVDPGIQIPAPDPTPQTTPVIPPPGTPGGDPNVQPK